LRYGSTRVQPPHLTQFFHGVQHRVALQYDANE
jgi:hypothetical protein